MLYKKIIKNLIFCFIFVFILCTNIFSVVLSDNNGSAFITKTELDSLRRNFENRLEDYYSTIDVKIEDAIKSYITRVLYIYTYDEKMDSTFDWKFPIICMNNSEWNDVQSKYYDYELPDIKDIILDLRAKNNKAKISSFLSPNPLYANDSNRSTSGATGLNENWFEIPEKYNELIRISDKSIDVAVGTERFKSYEIENVGKGRHRTVDYRLNNSLDTGHATSVPTYSCYTGVIGIGVNGARAGRDKLTVDSFDDWSTSTWTRKLGDGLSSSLGWGKQTTTPFDMPSDDLDLEGSKVWAATYSGLPESDSYTGSDMPSFPDSATRINNIKWENDSSYSRQWVYTGNSDAPATSNYGWCFDMLKPQTATEKFEGCLMNYQNDIFLTSINTNKSSTPRWYGYNSWIPHWFWKFKAGGSIDTEPSFSEFSKLPAKQVHYYDRNKNLHRLDEGLFLLNFREPMSKVEFKAKFIKIDESLSDDQKIKLKISSVPFDSSHDDSKNLKYKIGRENEHIADQIVDVGDTLELSVELSDDAKQLYMMWEPQTSGAYIGLSELSDFTVTTSGKK